MSALALMALLSFTLLLPLVLGEDDDNETTDIEEPVDPVDPAEPAIPTEPVTPVDPLTPVDPVDPNFPPNRDVGTDEADSLTASRDQVTNGPGSDDLIFVGSNATGAIISADAGNDQIEIDRASGGTVNGSNGDDLIFMEGTRDMVANGGRGDDIFRGGGQNFDLNGGDGDDRFELVVPARRAVARAMMCSSIPANTPISAAASLAVRGMT